MAKKGSPGSGDLHITSRGVRRWPLLYFLAALLLILLIPQLFYKIKLQSEALKRAKSVYGDNLLPTPWHWHDNQLGPHNRTWQRSLEILKCSYPSWFKPSHKVVSGKKATQCPSYFHWIEKDLSPWNSTGITSTHIEMAKEHAAFKVVILKGRLYVDLYYSCVQTRAVFTVWGMLLLLEKYEGKIPDVEIVFECMDRPTIKKQNDTSQFGSPPPLFRYCSNSKHYDIPWPDWSFWGWAETQLEPWGQELGKIVKGAKKNAWRLKVQKAYWRGNPDVGSPLRMQLLQCNNATRFPLSEIHDQNWSEELASGKQNSKLENQCDHRYKIYAEGFAWSVSFKYIMACGSPTLAISPKYYDFYMRGLEPWVHYIPVRPSEICAHKLCAALDKEVRFGERDILQAIQIGRAGQDFISNQVGMANVYDYMFHMLKAYSALQRFKPSVPHTATEVTQDFVLCLAQSHQRVLLEEARRHVPWSTTPCQIPETPGDEVKDFGWEAEEHADEGWSEQDCVPPRPKRSPKTGKNNSKQRIHSEKVIRVEEPAQRGADMS